jgi:hypothetical protein
VARKSKLCEYAQGIQERYRKRTEPEGQHVIGQGDRRGISFTFPPGWDDGSGKVSHVPDGPFKGRVMFTSRREAEEIGKRLEGKSGDRVRYDPD